MASPASAAHDNGAAAQPCSDLEFEELLTGMIEPAYRLALRLTHHPQDAEDLVQDAALRAYRFRRQFGRGTSFKAWFYRIVLNTRFTQARRERSRGMVDELADAHEMYLYVHRSELGLLAREGDPLGGTIARLTSEEVNAALDALPEEFRTVCVLYFMDDLSYQEIADIVGVPVGTVRSRLHRGRRMLQKRLWALARDFGVPAPAAPTEGEP